MTKIEDGVRLTVLRPFKAGESQLIPGYRVTVDRAMARALLADCCAKLTEPTDLWNNNTRKR